MRMRVLKALVPSIVLLLTVAGRAEAVELANTTPLMVPSNGGCCLAQVASSYPSSIEVSGVSGITTNVAVTLHEVSDPDSEDLAVLLVGPSGHGLVLMASYEQGRHQRLNDTTWTFETFAQPIRCPEPEGTFPSGHTFAPFDCGLADPFPAPAPAAPYEGVLEALGNNGVWSLYVVNQPGGEEGRIAGGWSLQIASQPIGSGPPEVPWTGQSDAEASAKVIQEHLEKEQDEQKTREAESHAAEEAVALKRREEEAAQQAAARVKWHRACVVPALKGDTLAAARRALAAAHCRLGTVHGRRRHHGTLRVSRQSARAGKRLADDARVALWIAARSDANR
jgi:hypothetical protein